MAEHTRLHLWLNTVIASGALVASLALTVMSYREYQLKGESIGLLAYFWPDCALASEDTGHVTLCWRIHISNQSDNRTSIIRLRIWRESDDEKPLFSTPNDVLEEMSGQSTTTPIVLDGGESRTYTAKISVAVPKQIVDFAQQLSKGKISLPLIYPQNAPPQITLRDLEWVAKDHDFDLLGNQLVRRNSSPSVISLYEPLVRKTLKASLTVFTGRGNSFAAQMIYPDF